MLLFYGDSANFAGAMPAPNPTSVKLVRTAPWADLGYGVAEVDGGVGMLAVAGLHGAVAMCGADEFLEALLGPPGQADRQRHIDEVVDKP